MKKIVIRRLFQSFAELERAIDSAEDTISGKSNTPRELLERIKDYREILRKQRNLAMALCGHASLENWEEVARHIKLINGLSLMIRNDAREIIDGTTTNPTREPADVLFC